jgi:hypothetical protein
MERACSTTGISSYCIISGGDDQAVQYFVFTLRSLQQGYSTNTASLNSPASGALKILCQHAVLSAHSSAVKGLFVTVNITAYFNIQSRCSPAFFLQSNTRVLMFGI